MRFVFDLSVEFDCLLFQVCRVGMRDSGREFCWVAECAAPAHQVSCSRLSAIPPGHKWKAIPGLDAAGISSPAVGQGQVQAKWDVLWQSK